MTHEEDENKKVIFKLYNSVDLKEVKPININKEGLNVNNINRKDKNNVE